MSLWSLVWLAWIIFGAAYEGITIRRKARGDTLSEQLENWFHTDAHFGRATWLIGWGVFAAWFAFHIATGLAL